MATSKQRKAILPNAMKRPAVLPAAADKPDLDKQLEAEEQVTVHVPRAFTFTRDDRVEMPIRAGIQDLPKSVVEHWFVKSQGVTTSKK